MNATPLLPETPSHPPAELRGSGSGGHRLDVTITPETDSIFKRIVNAFAAWSEGKIYTSDVPGWLALAKDDAEKIERDRNAMRDWIMQAAPMLSVASCLVIDEAVERLGEIEGCRGLLELCPVDFTNPENA